MKIRNLLLTAISTSCVLFSQTQANSDNLLLNNFDSDTLAVNHSFIKYGDYSDGGASTIAIERKEESSKFISFDYSLDRGKYQWDPYVNMQMRFQSSFDASEYEGIRYSYRGASHSISLEMNAVNDYSFHEAEVAESSEWRTINISFKRNLIQPNWGKQIPFSAEDIAGISWRVLGSTDESGTVDIDNIELVKSMPYVKQNDMVIRDAVIPERITVDGEFKRSKLQKRVSKYLSRGINLHNWLEEDEVWEGVYEYDRKIIQKYSQQGFSAVRFPIDLDRWVVDRDEVVAGNKEFAIDSTLFEILDSMYLWTEEYKMALTIDYHQYDKSLDRKTVVDPGYRKMVSTLWKSVAHYYADEKRADLFFELTNEPGIMDDIANPLWREMAKEMLDSIRTVNTFNSVIYGDSRWYDIDKLINNELFAPEDGNVIYAFHFYDPFIFTHQGADWAEQGSTGKVPFPYAKEKWSTEFFEFGIADGTPDWVKDGYHSYYKKGNANAMFNDVAVVKKWALKNNVVVVCNELGAYEKSSDQESLANYFRAIGDIFSSLKIGYGIWYGIFDKNEDLIPGVAESLGLNK